MKFKTSLFCLMMLASNFLYAQQFSQKFGELGPAETNLKYYSGDPAAEAVVLFDLGDTKFIEDHDAFSIQFTRSKRIKIFTEAGIKYGAVSIPLMFDSKTGRKEELKSVIARSYNADNGSMVTTEVKSSEIFEEKVNERWIRKRFVIPNVKKGSIIEYEYVILTPFLFNLPDWDFQDRIPTVYSKYTVAMIPFYEYSFLLQGANRFDYQTSTKGTTTRKWGAVNEVYGTNIGSGVKFEDMIHVYAMKNVPAFKDESYISSINDYIIKLDFQLAKIYSPSAPPIEVMTTWPRLAKDMIQDEYFGKYLNASARSVGKMLASESQIASDSEEEKGKAIINYVKSKFRWNNQYSIQAVQSVKDFISSKKGNSAEINLFLCAMLREAGLESYPVLISTREHGGVREKFPFINQFNTVVTLVYLNKKPVLCDGTDFLIQYDRIPSNCINERGLVVKNNAEEWVLLNLDYSSVDNKNVLIEIDPESLNLKIDLTIQALEYDAYFYKKSFENDTEKIKEYLQTSQIKGIENILTINYDNAAKPYIIKCEGKNEAERLNDNIIISPFLGLYPASNPFKLEERKYPVDFTYKNAEVYTGSIKIPAGYSVKSLPEDFQLDNELVRIILKYSANGEFINIEAVYSFKKPVYRPEEYKQLKDYYNIIVKRFNEQIIMSKL